MSRVRLTKLQAAKFFLEEGGRCHICGELVQEGQAWERSHPRPLELGGADDRSNWKVAHKRCHRTQTSKKDAPDIARARSLHATTIGAKSERKAKIAQRRKPKRGSRAPAIGISEIARRYGLK